MAITKQDNNKVEAVERIRSGKVFVPAVDIIDSEDTISLLADMPGTDEKSIDITLENDILTIQGSVNRNVPERFEPVYSEFEIGDYRRSFTLDQTIERDKIEANYKDGVLRLMLPKAEPAKPKKIAVKVG